METPELLVVAHVYNRKLWSETARWLARIPVKFALCLTVGRIGSKENRHTKIYPPELLYAGDGWETKSKEDAAVFNKTLRKKWPTEDARLVGGMVMQFKHARIWSVPNFGMDVGGFLFAMEELFQLEERLGHPLPFKYLLKLHTKTNAQWRRRLIKPLIGQPSIYFGHVKLLEDNKHIGMIGSHVSFSSGTNTKLLHQYAEKFGLQVEPKDIQLVVFIAGTIFLTRYTLMRESLWVPPFQEGRKDGGKRQCLTEIATGMPWGYVHDAEGGQLPHMFERLFGLFITTRKLKLKRADKTTHLPLSKHHQPFLNARFLP